MKSKTVKALRALAKQRGLKGYSKLSKDELVQRLQSTAAAEGTAVEEPGETAPQGEDATTFAAEPPSAPSPSEPGYAGVEPTWWEPTAEAASAARYASDEERVEGAKYALAPTRVPATAELTDLGEDIDRLPPVREPVLCLLPQKPGILHAYWAVPADRGVGQNLKLRLCRGGGAQLDVWEEVTLPAASGTWYFHVPESWHDREVELQLGYYREGQFVSAIPRGVARVPSLYASVTTDRQWWIGEEDFRRQYLRAGGFEAGRTYGWAASIGSPGAPPPEAGPERLGWPGGVSSR